MFACSRKAFHSFLFFCFSKLAAQEDVPLHRFALFCHCSIVHIPPDCFRCANEESKLPPVSGLERHLHIPSPRGLFCTFWRPPFGFTKRSSASLAGCPGPINGPISLLTHETACFETHSRSILPDSSWSAHPGALMPPHLLPLSSTT